MKRKEYKGEPKPQQEKVLDVADRRIALLFLAHDGIAQERLWEEWIKTYEDRILLYVVTNNTDKVPRHVVWHGIVVSYPLRWCDLSQVWALQRGLYRILRDDTNNSVKCVYFLSGAEIPARSALTLYQVPDQTRFCLGRMLPTLTLQQPRTKTEFKHALAYIDDHWDSVVQPYTHMAAFSMIRRDAEIIAYFPFQQLRALQKILKHHLFPLTQTRDSYQKAIERVELQWQATQAKHVSLSNTYRYYLDEYQRTVDRANREIKAGHTMIYRTCPDECLPYWMLFLGGADMKKMETFCITGMWRRGSTQGPLTFTDKTKSYYDLDHPQNISLERLLTLNASTEHPFFFFRKVSPSMRFKESEGWPWEWR